MLGAVLRSVASLFLLARLVRWLVSRAPRWRTRRVSPDALKLLDDVQPPTREEIELYVPEAYRNLGPDWTFTRGKVLEFSEKRKKRMVGSLGGFDLEREFEEEYPVYTGVYGYSDHEGRVHAFVMPPTENEMAVRPGRSFIICFNRRTPRVHHLFRPVRLSHPMKRHESS
jgi:hypothetical protein